MHFNILTFVQKSSTKKQNKLSRYMNVLTFLKCWLKIRMNGLSTTEFFALCEAFDNKKSKLAKKVLQICFRSITPYESWLDKIYSGSDELKLLYWDNIRRGRHLTSYEQERLLRDMPLNRFSRFPSKLDKFYLQQLFEKPNLLAAYVSNFPLPIDLERKLISRCADEDRNYPWGYRHVLTRYLSSAQTSKLLTPDVQLSVLALNDKGLTEDMIKNCSMDKNILFIPTMQYLAENSDREILSCLLLHSFVSDESAKKMLARFADLRWMYEISRLRRPLRKLEKDAGKFIGSETPTMNEHKFILQTIEKDVKGDKQQEFVREVLLPLITDNEVTPYFCAWAAHEFPEVSEKAYRKVRAIAETYRKIYKPAKK